MQIINKVKIFYIILLFESILVVSGCSVYQKLGEEDLKRTASATIRTPSAIYEDSGKLLTIESIDNLKPKVLQNAAVVSPGIHKISILIEFSRESKHFKGRKYTTKARASIDFLAEAGREYLLDSVEDEHGLWLWVEDKETGKIAGGSKP